MEKLLRRNLYDTATSALDAFPLLVIQGARQVGKSTFAAQLVANRPHRMFTLDDDDVRTILAEDARAFLEQYPDETVVLDEVQREPKAILAVKAAVDRLRRPGRFILTGSSDLLHMPGSPDSLVGRSINVTLCGLSQGELAGQVEDFAHWIRGDSFKPAEVHSSWARQQYVQAILRGGYPELRTMTDHHRDMWLDTYVLGLLQRDAQDIRHLSPNRLESVLRLLAANQSGELVKSRVANQAGVSESSMTNYLDTLKNLFLVSEVHPWTANLTRREIGRPKAWVTDSAVAAWLSALTEQQLAPVLANPAIGGLMEGFVASELAKQLSWSAERARLFHYRDKTGTEVDLVIEYADGRVVLVEVKTTASHPASAFTSLRYFAERLGDRLIAGIVLGTGSEGMTLGSRLHYLPISSVWEHPPRGQGITD
ncbi:MAG: ATP-binding protein [Propionibacteriaceae bacterium]|jgi:predicted AAA+ superfamily ATPase|nr:ATP-binding protein [Propionibacteriaceae bacterium]